MKNKLKDERPTSADGIKQVCRRVWRDIGPDYLVKLYESMPRRMQAVIDVKGGHTKYWTCSIFIYLMILYKKINLFIKTCVFFLA